MFRRSAAAGLVIGGLCILTVLPTACGGRTVVVAPRGPVAPEVLAQLRIDPGDRPRDLFWGVGGRRRAPAGDALYSFQAKDEAGFSVSYDVLGPDGLEWSAKIGPEAQTEVVVSRILWGLGYHQPPVYYLPSWRLQVERGAPRQESEARFRPKLPNLERLEEAWSWADNPFSGTRELKGLLVILLMLNSTDLKDSNNSIYVPNEPWDGTVSAAHACAAGCETVPDTLPGRWFVVRDLGAALGETGRLFPRRNWLEGFERESFITKVSGTAVELGYGGLHRELLAMVGPEDVQWAAREMARLTDEQWRDAFRAANYAVPHAERYIARIKEKIDDGLALRIDRREEE